MTRYWDSWAESLESVMRFISERNWSSVGVAIFVVSGDGLLNGVWLNACWVQGRWSRKSHAALKMWWSVHHITKQQEMFI